MLLGHSLPQKGNCEITFNYSLLCVVMCVLYTFRNLDCNPEEKSLFGSHTLVQPKKRKRYMRFGTWNVRSLYRAGSLTAAT